MSTEAQQARPPIETGKWPTERVNPAIPAVPTGEYADWRDDPRSARTLWRRSDKQVEERPIRYKTTCGEAEDRPVAVPSFETTCWTTASVVSDSSLWLSRMLVAMPGANGDAPPDTGWDQSVNASSMTKDELLPPCAGKDARDATALSHQ